MIVVAYRTPTLENVEQNVHVVRWWQWFAAAARRRQAPVALCGVTLAGDLDPVDPDVIDEPMCGSCLHQVKRRARWWR